MFSAYLLIQVGPGKSKAITEEISKIEGVKTAQSVTGVFDIIAYVEAADLSMLSDTVLTRIQAIDGVQRTQTAVVAFPMVEKAVKPRVYKKPPSPKEFVEETVRAAVAKDPSLIDRPLEVLRMVRTASKEKGYRSTIAPTQLQAILRKSK